MDRLNSLLSHATFGFVSYSTCNHMTYILLSVLVGTPWLSVAHKLEVDLIGGHLYDGLIRLSLIAHNSSAITQEGVLCDDEMWNYNTANAVCKQAGYKGVFKILHDAERRYGKQSANFHLHGLSCTGRESSLMECSFKSWSTDLCSALAGVHCKHQPSHKSSDGFFGSFFSRVIVCTVFVPLLALSCVLCRCCYRYKTERNRYIQRHRTILSRNNTEQAFQLDMDADSRAALPTYDEFMKDTSDTFPRPNDGTDEGDREDSAEEPPPSYDIVIGSWTDDQRHIHMT